MARRSKYSSETQQKILKAIRLGVTYQLASAFGGVSYETFNEWRKTKPQFSDALREAEGEAAVALLAKIQKAATDGDWRAAAFLLERRYPHAYGRNVTDEEHRGEVHITITRVNGDEWRGLGAGRPRNAIVEAGRTEVDEDNDALREA